MQIMSVESQGLYSISYVATIMDESILFLAVSIFPGRLSTGRKTCLKFFSGAGRPGRTAPSVGDFKKRFEESQRKVGELNREIEQLKQARTAEIAKLTFLLIAVGLSGRVIAWILRTAFGLKDGGVIKCHYPKISHKSLLFHQLHHQLVLRRTYYHELCLLLDRMCICMDIHVLPQRLQSS